MIRKSLLCMLAIATMMASCNSKKASSSVDDDEEEAVELEFKKFTYEKSEGICDVSIKADYPVDGSEDVVKAIREYLRDAMGGDETVKLNADGDNLLTAAGERRMQTLREASGDIDPEYVPGCYIHETLSYGYENDYFITIIDEQEEYLGGVHGVEYQGGATFSKSTGKRFDESMLKTGTSDFNQLLKEGMKRYFCETESVESMTDGELKDYLLGVDDLDNIPMPGMGIYLSAEGVVFTYQPYEVSYYAAGLPQFTVTYKDIKPFLTKAGKRFIEGDDDDDD